MTIFLKSNGDTDSNLLLKIIDELIFLTKRQGYISKEDIDLIIHLISGEGNNDIAAAVNGDRSENNSC